ncbi:hypothetical protein RhiirA4_450895 [Rhizophagus irregularis]|uniref:RNase H type-1 domain-containing protein n=1 Tax=Rhizophagus irregularis TaxID=588596 RepID=A0A2I1FUB2_9GLOM|nr:hypothetical protein RhiirA4_450895 [Rhizophagus irregularis]
MEKGNISPDELYPVDIRLTVWFDLVNLATFSCFAKNVLPHVISMSTILNNKNWIYVCFDDVSEWLRSVTRNHMGSARTDSQAAINGINNLINIKQLDFSIVKIKGHSDCKWNDTADYLAKSGIDIALENNNRILDSKSLCSFSFPLYFLPIWSDIAIDRNIWNFTKGVANLLEEVKWSYNGYWANYFNDEQSQIGVYWNTYWSYLQNISRRNCTNFYANKQFIHFIKCSNNLLPTVDNLCKRNNAYDLILCPSCNETDEFLSHLTTCKGTE